MGRQVTDARAKKARQAARAHIRSLLHLVIQPATAARYRSAITRFAEWRKQLLLPPLASIVALDENISVYIDHLWQEGDPRGYAGDLLSGLQHQIPALRGQLPSGWRLLTAWRKAELPTRATPFTLFLVQAAAGYFMGIGKKGQALGLLLGFHALLRTGELQQIRKRSCTFAPDGTSAIISLGFTKSGKRRGEPESVIVDDPALVSALQCYFRQRPAEERLIDCSNAAFRKSFSSMLVALGLDTSYKPYSMRRGGATHTYLVSKNLSLVTQRGRWQNMSTARLYVNEAAAELGRLFLTAAAQQRLGRHVATLRMHLAQQAAR